MKPNQHVFISHASVDKSVVDAIVARIESRGIKCWYAPRDIVGGASYGSAIVEAIKSAGVMVVVVSEASCQSSHVLSEVERAVHNGVHIIPFRIEALEQSGELEFFLSSRHWLDAVTPPLEKHISALCDSLELVVSDQGKSSLQMNAPPRRDSKRIVGRIAAFAALGIVAAFALWQFKLRNMVPQTSPVTSSSEESSTRAAPSSDEPRGPTLDPPDSGRTPIGNPDRGSLEENGSLVERGSTLAAGSLPTNPMIIAEGRVGLPDGLEDVCEYRAPDHGRVTFTLVNTTPGKAQFAEIGLEVGDRGFKVPPGDSRPTLTYSVRKGQGFSIRVHCKPDHRGTYRLEAKFESLAGFQLSVPEESGKLTRSSAGSVGFEGGTEDLWTYQAPDHGCVTFTLVNTTPGKTQFAQIALEVGDQGGFKLSPGEQPRSTRTYSTRKGQVFNVRVSCNSDHRGTYRMETKFESLAELQLSVPEESGKLSGSSAGSVGFEGGNEDVWTYQAPDHGRVTFTLENRMPSNVLFALIRLTIDGKARKAEPGSPLKFPTLSVSKGQQVELRVHCDAGQQAVYRLEANFQSP